MRSLLIPLVLVIAACGQKGPLYLPQETAQPASSAPAVSAPAPTRSENSAQQQERDKRPGQPQEQQATQPNTEAEAVSK